VKLSLGLMILLTCPSDEGHPLPLWEREGKGEGEPGRRGNLNDRLKSTIEILMVVMLPWNDKEGT